MKFNFHESVNGYPAIRVEEPFELVGEFLQALHSPEQVSTLLSTIESFQAGLLNYIDYPQDCALLQVKQSSNIANFWIDDLSMGEEREINVPLEDFVLVTQQWLDYLLKRKI